MLFSTVFKSSLWQSFRRSTLIFVEMGFLFCLSISAHAAPNIDGRLLKNIAITHRSRSLSANFAKIETLQIKQNSFSNFDAIHLEVATFIWDRNQASSANFSQAKLNNSHWNSSRFNSIQFAGSELRNSVFKDVQFDRCDFDYSDLRGAQFQNSILGDCTFHHVQFDDASVFPFDAQEAIKMGMIYVH